MNPSEILYRARQSHCRALYKISEEFINYNGCYGSTRSCKISVEDRSRADSLHCYKPGGLRVNTVSVTALRVAINRKLHTPMKVFVCFGFERSRSVGGMLTDCDVCQYQSYLLNSNKSKERSASTEDKWRFSTRKTYWNIIIIFLNKWINHIKWAKPCKLNSTEWFNIWMYD